MDPANEDLDAIDAAERATDAASAAYALLYNAAKKLNQDMFPDAGTPNFFAYDLKANQTLERLVLQFVEEVSTNAIREETASKIANGTQLSVTDRMTKLANNIAFSYVQSARGFDKLG